MVAYPGSYEYRANKRTAMRFPHASFFAELQYNQTQGLFGAILLELNDEWAVQRARSMTLETIASFVNQRQSATWDQRPIATHTSS
jgi:hypothetical protein